MEDKNSIHDSLYNSLIGESFLHILSPEEQQKHQIESKKIYDNIKWNLETKTKLSLLRQKIWKSFDNTWNEENSWDSVDNLYLELQDSDEANFHMWLYSVIRRNEIREMTDFFSKSLAISNRFEGKIFEFINDLLGIILNNWGAVSVDEAYFIGKFKDKIERIIKIRLKIVEDNGEKRKLLDFQKFLKTL